MRVNPPALSKINWTNGISFVAAVAAVFGLDIDPTLQLKIVAGLALATPVVTMVFRTFFTAKPAA